MTDLVTAIATVLTVVAAAIAAGISMRQTKLLAKENELARSVARFELFRSMENSYIEIYPRIVEELGPWDDIIEVDGSLRRCVHDLASHLSSVYNAQSLGVVEPRLAAYVSELYLDWLRTPKAREVWESVFAVQVKTWPPGFVDWVDDRLGPTTTD